MPPTSSLIDCRRLADAVNSLGGTVPDALQHLLTAHDILARPQAAERPETAIMDAALDGTLTEAKLAKLLPVASALHAQNVYRGELARLSEHTLVGQFHRELAAGGADQILDSLRDNFDRHAKEIAHARSLIPAESTAEHVLAAGQRGTLEAWQALPGHLAVVAKIGAIASQFGCRLGNFPQLTEYAQGDNFRLADQALVCTDGPLAQDSALFQNPDAGHRNSPWARATLRLHSIESARARYRDWAADEFDRIHAGPQGGWIDEHGAMHENRRPTNPYREKAST